MDKSFISYCLIQNLGPFQGQIPIFVYVNGDSTVYKPLSKAEILFLTIDFPVF